MQRADLIHLLRERSLKRAPQGEFFTLASGKKSTTYLDVRKTALSAEGHKLLGSMIFNALLWELDAVAGVALGGCPLASAVSMVSADCPKPLPAIYVRKEPKSHGSKNLVEGPFTSGMKVALLEDVVTTGGSSLQALQALRDAGLVVQGILAVVDREEGAAEAFRGVNVPFQALTTLREVAG